MTEVVRPPVRERLLDAAHAIIESRGWSHVTMSGVAVAAGVSRQTVYNEVGTKHGLAEQLALRELERFLAVVSTRMAAETVLVDGIRSACEGVLLLGEESLLVRTIVGLSPADQDNDFLKILTTESGEIVEAGVAAVQAAVVELYPPTHLSPAELTVALEAIVRLVISALTRPSKPPAQAAADIGWITGLVLKGAASR
jgi:AcrR family transcriptional regulator